MDSVFVCDRVSPMLCNQLRGNRSVGYQWRSQKFDSVSKARLEKTVVLIQVFFSYSWFNSPVDMFVAVGLAMAINNSHH
ncbi:MAG: hypothetical protein AAF959_12740 [Cyanobacteria bacterium P01_D01_bin.56]